MMFAVRSASYTKKYFSSRVRNTHAAAQLKSRHKWSSSPKYVTVADAVAERDRSPFFISTPIYYVNGQPHLGHAYTSVVSDVMARFQRADGRDVYFLTGTDEHGQKVEQSALAAGKTPMEFANDVSSQFRHLVEVLDCSHDDFIRTTEERHKAAVAELWDKLEENGQIYLGAYEGW